MTNPQGSSHGGRLIVHSSKGNSVNETVKEFHLKPGYAIKTYSDVLTDFEKGEILGFWVVYCVGEKAEKVKGSCIEQYNNGYDDENGDYKVVLNDHIAYWYEVVDWLGSGSFG